MMKVFAAVLLLLLILSDCRSEVVQSFTERCPQFFANPNGVRSPPTIFPGSQYKQICQIRENAYEFATLYDTTNRIPVYSAYEFTGRGDCSRLNQWYIEPQLDNQNAGPRMIFYNQQLQNQAVNDDYEKSGYDKGHLVPVYHAETQSCADATYTLTNAAPQNKSNNRGKWRVAEKEVAVFLESECKDYKTFIVTGVIPGQYFINNRVNIPSYYWSGFCCLDDDNNNNKAKISGGFYGENKKEKVSKVTLRELESKLTALYKKGPFSVFNRECYMPENEPDMWLLYKECMDKGGNYRKFRMAIYCVGKNTNKETIRRCINRYCTRKTVYRNRERYYK